MYKNSLAYFIIRLSLTCSSYFTSKKCYNTISTLYPSCSFVEPQDAGGVIVKSGETKASMTKPSIWNANCGGAFGHELTFQRTLELEMGQSSSFEAVKNARGGTEIHRHWYVQTTSSPKVVYHFLLWYSSHFQLFTRTSL